jgi:hypothetical protein
MSIFLKKMEWAIGKGEKILQCGKGYNEMYRHLALKVKLTCCKGVSLK